MMILIDTDLTMVNSLEIILMRYLLHEFIMTSTISLLRAIQSHAETELHNTTKHSSLISKYVLAPEAREAAAIEVTGAQPARSKLGLNKDLNQRIIMNEARDMKFVSLHQKDSNSYVKTRFLLGMGRESTRVGKVQAIPPGHEVFPYTFYTTYPSIPYTTFSA